MVVVVVVVVLVAHESPTHVGAGRLQVGQGLGCFFWHDTQLGRGVHLCVATRNTFI